MVDAGKVLPVVIGFLAFLCMCIGVGSNEWASYVEESQDGEWRYFVWSGWWWDENTDPHYALSMVKMNGLKRANIKIGSQEDKSKESEVTSKHLVVMPTSSR